MNKIMLAIGHREFEESLIKQIKDRYTFTGVATYREAVLSEANNSKPDIIVIRENLNGTANMTNIIYALREQVPSARIIFLALEHQAGDELMATLVSYGVYDLLVGSAVKISSVINLIDNPNTFSDVSVYSTRIEVDENGNRKIFNTKIIQVPSPITVEAQNKPLKPIQQLVPQGHSKKNEQPIRTIDEEIPLVFIQNAKQNNNANGGVGALRAPEDKQNKNVKYDGNFYTPEDYLTKTSKPSKPQQGIDFHSEPVESIIAKPNVTKEAEFDFEIVDSAGNPVVDTEIEKTPVILKPEPVLEPKLIFVEPQPVIEQKQEPLPEVKLETIISIKEEIKPQTEPVISVKKEVDDDLLGLKNPTQPTIAAQLPPTYTVENKKEVIAEPVKQIVTPMVVEGDALPAKRNKLLNGDPIPMNVNTLLFVRSEEYAENHSALNVAIKLAKDEKKVLFVECSKESSFDYFVDSLQLLKDKLVYKKMDESFGVLDLLTYARNNPLDYIVMDAYIESDLSELLMLNGKRFLLIKQNKTWIQHTFGTPNKIAIYAKFALLVIEEYAESGMSPKTLMIDYRPFGVLKIKEKKETNFFAINAKMPAMLSKKNMETLDAYKDIMDYIYGKGDNSND